MSNLLQICFVLIILYTEAHSEEYNTTILVESYQRSLNTTLELVKTHRTLVNNWLEEFQLNIINVTTRYRVLMAMHKDHNFMMGNSKWRSCLESNKRGIENSEKTFNEAEIECLRATSIESKGKVNYLEQLDKEIRKWRKGFRYLVNLCKANPGDDGNTNSCLVDYMQTDNYDQVLARLMLLKREAMDELYLQFASKLNILEECLRINVSLYLENVQVVRDHLDNCYKL